MKEYTGSGIRNWAVEDRPREKMLLKGIRSLSDSELLALLIGSGTKKASAVDLARQVLGLADNNLEKLGKYGVPDLKKLKGIGEARAVTIMAALELGRRRNASEIPEGVKIGGSQDVFSLMGPLLSDLPHEEFWILLLNRANKIIEKHRISQGGITGTVTDVRMILKIAIDSLATSMILCHNHPSGNLNPSEADLSITRRIRESASLMDITVLDHLIVAGRAYYSLADENQL
jgi:DNA repair protein RadC